VHLPATIPPRLFQYRLTPPPAEAYSLHRKLAGAILLCIKLKVKMPCRDILEKTWAEYKF
jgi:aarF domain-containing kinase